MRYIDAYKLIAEIERLKERAQAERVLHPKTILAAKDYLLIQDYDKLLSFITSLQQEQPEVDFEREIIKYKVPFSDDREYLNEQTIDAIARHFYEFGLNARK